MSDVEWTIRDDIINDVKSSDRHACVRQFPDGSWGWWPYGEQGFPEKSPEHVGEAVRKYLATGQIPRRKKTKTITLDSLPEAEEPHV